MIVNLVNLQEQEYKCKVCNKWFAYNIPKISCTVYHPPGTCCHYGDTEIEEPSWSKEQTV
jgi:hypothetical protein